MTKEERRYWIRHGKPDPLRAFMSHRHRAKRRGIEFQLTFDQWWSYWVDYYHLRGTTKGCMCMCRFKDEGPYAVGNVRIDSIESNAYERRDVLRDKSPIRLGFKRTRFPEVYEEAGWANRNSVFDEYREASIWDEVEA